MIPSQKIHVLWVKIAASGNIIRLGSFRLSCDSDVLLWRVSQMYGWAVRRTDGSGIMSRQIELASINWGCLLISPWRPPLWWHLAASTRGSCCRLWTASEKQRGRRRHVYSRRVDGVSFWYPYQGFPCSSLPLLSSCSPLPFISHPLPLPPVAAHDRQKVFTWSSLVPFEMPTSAALSTETDQSFRNKLNFAFQFFLNSNVRVYQQESGNA